ncbi:hypothetical protein [Aquirufa regiilacus]|uniref:Uncharacterized protein n=1 Tax=Aquirufa regiilacus TaxID=3024868 RepID=A0ABU3TUR3_9BACT|nr:MULTISPECIES: hypothetical protein [unclassified Aquirufa]MDT8888326.1 hypothetical protein [Aquirufa sp. LEPPI-3A]MDU0809621.1 hypothetical protein [Aquirufa sp. LEOWEIH-7C]
MKPNIFLHYWNQEGQTLSFQEVLSLDCDPIILATIQAELMEQLTSGAIVEKLPNFDWSNLRMQEKWNSIAQTLLMQVQLPEQIWLDWIQALGGQTEVTYPEVPSFADLLNAEVFFERPSDSLEDLPEEEEVTLEAAMTATIEIEENDLQAVAWEDSELTLATQTTPDYFEVSHELPDLSEISPEEVKTQSIQEMLADSKEEKVLDTIQVDDHSLKNLVANQMTSSLAESISLFQRLNFIQELFDGNAEQFSQFIEFIDFEASPANWKSAIAERYDFPESAASQELMLLIERKFS